MSSREKQIEALQNILIDNGIFNNLICRQDYANPDALINDLCLETAQVIYNNNYRKMDEVTLKLDLGDRSAEEIQQIAEMFEKAMGQNQTIATVSNNEEEIAKKVAKEIIQIMKQVQAMFYDKEYVAIQNLIAEKYGVEIDE